MTVLNIIHRNAGQDAPGSSKVVNRAMRMITRQAVYDGEEQGQAIPFHRTDLEALAQRWKGSARLQELRDLAFVGVAYNTMLRVAEVGRIRMQDIKFQMDGSALIKVGHTKTTLTSAGIMKNLSPLVAGYVRAWVDAAGLADQPEKMLFCRVHRVNKAVPGEKPMSNEALISIFERAWMELNDHRNEPNKGRYETWTGHSCRVGACIDLLEAGASLEQIMVEGNWKSPEMVLHYLRHALAGKSHLSALLSRDISQF
ncbi:tyrosine-type recombinase/integrase [Enterobacter hormaechei]